MESSRLVTRATVPALAARIVHRPGEGVALLVDRRRPIWAALSLGAEEFVRLADGRRSVAGIAGIIAARHDVPAARVEADAEGFFGDLARAGFLTPPPAPPPTPPITTLFLHVTDRCNLTCIHCYAASGPTRGDGLDAGLILRYARALADGGPGRQVVLSGGEPLARADFADLVRRIDPRLSIRLLTNGTLVTDATAALLADREGPIQVSLDGPTAAIHDRIRGPGTFAKALRAIETFQRRGLGDRLNVCAVFQAENAEALPELARLVHRLGVPLLRVLPLRRQGHARARYADPNDLPGLAAQAAWYDGAILRLADELPGLRISPGVAGLALDLSGVADPSAWCPLGQSLVFDAAGSLYPCALFMAPADSLGDATHSDLARFEASPKRAAIIRRNRERRDRLPECRDCTWAAFCQAGCPGIAAMHHGTTERVDGFCGYRKRMYERLLFDLVARKGDRRPVPAEAEGC
jgi:radical SAM protein with 4Fe4S-binding SPASM domain